MRTGLWIPVEIEVLPLNLTEKVLLAEIVSLDRVGECFASNEHFSKLLGIRPDSASRMISKLKKLGYIKQTGFDGRKRKLTPVFETKSKTKVEPILSKVLSSTSNQSIPKSKSRVGDSAEAAFAISNDPIKKVQLNKNVQKSWEDFLEWSRERVTLTTWDIISNSKDPESLSGSGLLYWKNWICLNR
ncbi:helix-turn-helix domain-containing protein [Leptospira bouyouniensis]|uniref:Helix-turn-helix domain-containing protein n=1 Tax=Leptospira bouyouniensis TaxID=2484911 RepID=A0ABY2L0H2_9LEPT|nr:helix-turn-helix domain-containing protein [Leptospira bouyouniensis]TGK45531.1 helix-turn-helix domain-containing protein [Leptospira bouyouniensis]